MSLTLEREREREREKRKDARQKERRMPLTLETRLGSSELDNASAPGSDPLTAPRRTSSTGASPHQLLSKETYQV
jgi:hypothetical protein